MSPFTSSMAANPPMGTAKRRPFLPLRRRSLASSFQDATFNGMV